MLTRFICTVAGFLLSASANAALDVQQWTTNNGARVLLVENHGLPMVDVRVIFDAGSARDGKLSGLALLTNSLLDEGAGGKNATRLAEEFESVGAQVSLESLRDMSYAGLRSLSDAKYLDKALETFSLVLTRPDFPRDAFERQMARFKVSVRSREQSPGEVAEEAFYRELYRDHPYATPVSGTLETLEQISLQDIKQHYRQYYVAKNASIVIVGDVDRAQAEKIAGDLSAGLQTGVKARPIPEVKPLTEPVTRYIDFPSTQSHIYIGQPGMQRGHADYFDLYVANHPFGGSGFASRLMDSVREQRGLAYSVYSYFSPMREAGPFMMGMQTKNEQAAEAIEILEAELEKYLAEGPSADEMKDSISNITGSFPLNLDSNSKVTGYLAMIAFYELDVTYLDRFLDDIRAVTGESAKKAFAEMIDPDRMVTIVVGKQAADGS